MVLTRNLAAALAAAVVLISTGLAAAADAPASHPDGSTPLQWAVFEGNIAEVKRLLAAGANPGVMNDYGVDAMQLAADESNTELLRLLLKAGANPNSVNPEGETVLHLVARSGNLDAAKLLVNAGAQVDARERFGGQTPLMWATARRHPDLVQFLASKGADVNARSAARDYLRVVTAESRAKHLDWGGFTPLMYAARENCRECVPILLKYHADMSVPDPGGMPPLSIALMNGTWDIAKALIEAGADVNQWDVYGQGPLNVAIANLNVRGNGNPLDRDTPDRTTPREVVKLLLEHGADPNQQLYYHAAARNILGADTGRGTTPFLTACASGDIEIVKLLLVHGANPRLATSDGQGPIILATAARTGGTGFPNARIAGVAAPPREVIDDVAERQKDGKGPHVNPTVELIKLLAANGADVNLMSKRHFLQRTRGGSALHYATRAGNKEVMAALVKLGIDVNAKDDDGLTALDYAMGRGYVPFLQLPQEPRKDLADLLRGWGAKVELDRTPNWPPQGAAVGTAVYDAVIWPVDPVGP
ncbi:MAG TPA: ankyrin repeat domain-containing protein [Steroidobacteraceae bacterium]|nr:ankyrin repeat domain-containing protein [Steroidobacteraceae bacterium]